MLPEMSTPGIEKAPGAEPGGGGRGPEEISAPVWQWVIRIDRWHPTRVNQLLNAHWAKRARMKRVDAQLIGASIIGAGVPRFDRARRRVGLQINLGYRQRAGDPDAYWKSLLDGLVECAALVDDSRTWCELVPVIFCRKAVWGSVIGLSDLGRPQ